LHDTGGGSSTLSVSLEKLLIYRLVRRSGLYSPIVLILALPTIVLLYFIKKAILIRFGEIPGRLGHMSADLDTYISLKRIESPTRTRKIDFLCKPSSGIHFNEALIFRCSRSLNVLPRLLVVPFNIVINEIQTFNVHRLNLTPPNLFAGELNATIHNLSSPIRIEKHEIQVIQSELERRSIPSTNLIVLALRDSLFSSDLLGTKDTYTSYRNLDEIQSKTLIVELARLGFGVVRAGSKARELEIDHDVMFWDYANSKVQSDSNDLVLFSVANFCIGCDTGLHELAFLNRKPLYLIATPAFTNKLTSPLLRLVAYCDFLDSNTNNPIGLAEMRDRGVFSATGPEHFKRIGVRPSRMHEDDISNFAREVYEFENGFWEESAESSEIKKVFLDYLEPYGFRKDSKFRFPNYWSKKSNWLS
jgi:putative glycosyltransferase (TIGR04372 family)